MTFMTEQTTREARQKKFYRDVFPIEGQLVALTYGGFTPSSPDTAAEEMRETFRLWHSVQASGSNDIIADSAWWMTHITDPKRRMSQEEYKEKSMVFQSYAVATLGQLMEQGIVQWVEEPDIPTMIIMSDATLDDEETAAWEEYEAWVKGQEETSEEDDDE